MRLWDHQQRGLNELARAIRTGERNICVTSPTGGGKSRMMFEEIHNSLSKEVALYTDRRMLLSQISEGLTSEGIEHGVRAAGVEPALLRRIQLAMVQTEGSRCLNGISGAGTRDVHACDLLMIDEAHKMAAGTMAALDEKHLEANPDRVKVGFTATPLGIGHFYDRLIVAGTLSELRACGALLPAYSYGPDEPDTKWIGKIVIGEGECGLPNARRMEYAHRVFGRVVENYHALNPKQLPALLFAPGVKESKWLAEQLTEEGITADHIGDNEIWMEGETLEANDENRALLAERSKSGRAKVLCNRFIMREGINWPWIYHGILATVFGSLTSYIQAGGRILRNDPSLPGKVIIQDHGGNWWRHGSLNADREWRLEYNDRIVAGLRAQRLREKKEPEPIVCPKCHGLRTHGKECPHCGHTHTTRTRPVLQKDGKLKEVRGDIFRRRRELPHNERLRNEWASRVRAIRNSRKETVQRMTFAQAEVAFARDHNWGYPPHTLPEMPVNDADWFRPIREVPRERLRT